MTLYQRLKAHGVSSADLGIVHNMIDALEKVAADNTNPTVMADLAKAALAAAIISGPRKGQLK